MTSSYRRVLRPLHPAEEVTERATYHGVDLGRAQGTTWAVWLRGAWRDTRAGELLDAMTHVDVAPGIFPS